MTTPKIILSSDHSFNLDCLNSFLSKKREIELIGKYTIEELRHQLLLNHFDILVLDVCEQTESESLKHLFHLYHEKKILILTSSTNHYFLSSMLHLGARGCFIKSDTADHLSNALLDLFNNNAYLPTELFNKLYCELPSKFNNGSHRVLTETHHEVPILAIDTLTTRELEILKLLVAGESSCMIAKELFISELTVNTHRKHILKKLGVNNTSTLIRCALEQGVF